MGHTDQSEEAINQAIFSQREAANQEPEEKTVTETTGYVSGCELLNVRRDPNPDADILGRIGKDAKVTIHKKDGDWYNVSTSMISGWCMVKYIKS